jgi:1-acyl-sn-glycerol-3-phosphate acyltransferase
VSAPGVGEVHWWPPRRGLWPPIWYFARAVLRPTITLLLGFRVAGRRRIPRSGGVLVVANHLADIDPPFVGMACVPRPAEYLADARHFTGRPLATVLFALGAFPVRMGEADARAMRYARGELEAGRLVVVFPEGTPSWGPRLREFRDGVGLLGLTPGVTVLPAAVWGTHKVMRGWRVVGRGPVLVAFGHPLEVPQEGSRRERAAELTRRARSAIEELLEPMVRAHP